MFPKLELLTTAMSLARYAGFKQSLTAQNIANADTPGFRALALGSFESLAEDAAIASRGGGRPAQEVTLRPIRQGALDPNGNGIDLEQQILTAVDAKRQHDKALAIYRSSLNMLRSTLSK